MEVKEVFLQGKYKNGTGCEDGYLINDDFVVVVDGATSQEKHLWDGKASGEYAKDLILETMQGMKADTKCDRCFEMLHDALKVQFAKDKDIPISEELRASLLIYSRYYREIWCLGDCNYMVNGRLYENGKKVDAVIAEIRSMVIRSLLAEGRTEEELLEKDISRRWIMPLIERQYYLENMECDFGYPELNSTSLNCSMIKRLGVKKGDQIVLATDGYPELKATLAESEQEVKRVMQEDPLCYKIYRTTKGAQESMVNYDDRCYVGFVV